MSTDKEQGNATRGSLRLAPTCVELEEHKAEFVKTVDEFQPQLLINSYSTVGLRTNVDFMIWRIGYELDPIQEMTSKLNHTQMAKYLEPSQSFLSMTKRSMYIDKDNPAHVEDR